MAQGAFGPIEGSHWLHEIAGLRIGGHLVEQTRMLDMDLAPISRRLGHAVHGIVDSNVLSRLVILVDYGAAEVTFASSEDPRPFGELGEQEQVIPFALLSAA